MLEFLLSVILLPVALILIIIAGIAIRVEDGDPIFYLSDRLGKEGKIFKMYKLRSMKVNSPDLRFKDGCTYNSESDVRVTRVGKIIRKASIDEIPQLFNVIKGDMAIIGPRPDTIEAMKKYTEEEKIILTVRPGITGYNQVISRKSVVHKEKLRNDIIYVNNLSFLFDLKILLLTVKSVLFSKNIYRDESVYENEDAVTEVLNK
jgi:lipopolysaccharide/colanic/teichoic acid biosynthesis glycosyltransferase